ncbi:MAG: hypothetical protein O2983_10885, partial [Planctomycetota bacterium]|nr:hypothetical protein [Planctomycetota bacterium]
NCRRRSSDRSPRKCRAQQRDEAVTARTGTFSFSEVFEASPESHKLRKLALPQARLQPGEVCPTVATSVD